MEWKKITQEEFDDIYEKHQLWLESGKKGEKERKGERADLSFTDLQHIKLPRNFNLPSSNLEGCNIQNKEAYMANLYNTNLRNSNLSRTNFQRANLEKANLERANLSYCNVIKTDFDGANLSGTNFEGTDIERAIGLPAYLKKDEDSKLQTNLNKLETEKEKAEAEIKRIRQELEKKGNLSEEIRKELEKEKAQREQDKKESEKAISRLEKEKEQMIQEGKDIEQGLKEAFAELEKANDNLKPDFKKLQYLFYSFAGLIVLFFALLLVLWICAFNQYSEGVKEDFNPFNLWVYVSPSLILVGFIGVSIAQVNKIQSRLVALKKYSRKYDIIKIGLEGYYKVENKLNKKPHKAQEVFGTMIERALTEQIDTDAEEAKTKRADSKDQIPLKQAIDTLADYYNKIK